MSAAVAATPKPPAPGQAPCAHCGTPVPRGDPHEGYCCAGCAYVARLISDEGLERYYDLRDKTIPPVKGTVFAPRDYGWLEERVTAAEASGGAVASTVVGLQGISCVGCVWIIEKLFRRHAGGRQIEINAQRGEVRLEWTPGSFDAVAFAEDLQRHGYLLGPAGEDPRRDLGGLLTRVGLCAAFALNAMLFTLPGYLGMDPAFAFADLFALITVLAATLSLAVGGSYFAGRAWSSLKAGVLHIDLPIALGVFAAYGGSLVGWLLGDERLIYFDFVAVFIFLMLGGRWLQEHAVARNRSQLLALNPRPRAVTRLGAEGAAVAVAVEEIAAGDALQIVAGQAVPVQGRLRGPAATVSLEWINGEAAPVVYRRGAIIPAGALVLDQEGLSIEAVERWEESLLARLLQRSETTFRHRTLERILRIYLGAVLVIATLGGAVWLAWAPGWTTGLQVFVSVLVVSCPCALGVSWPLADERAVARLRRKGVYLREPTLWERLGAVRMFLFDKTGTLTLEAPELLNRDALRALPETERAVLARLVERSLHPVGRALREELLAFDPGAAERVPILEVREIPGFGVETSHAGQRYRLGRPGWTGREETVEASTDSDTTEADTIFAIDGRERAAFRFREAVREDARAEIAALRARYPVYLLSGDRRAKVAAMLDHLGLPAEAGMAEMTPTDKAAWMRRHAEGRALFVGDGANDSLAFQAAAVRATPVIDKGLLEHQADFFFLGRGLGAIREVLVIAARRQRALRAILGFAIAYNLVAVAICLAALMNPLLAAVLMPLSSLVSLSLVRSFL